jgi:uncharacterized protein
VRVLKDQWIDASDGARLCVDVYLPDDGGPVPCLYAVSPYQKDLAHLPASEVFRFRETGPIEWWVDECGYSVNQWNAIATRPPHLACSVIYNGFTDLYRDAIYHGGIFSMGFYNFWTVDNVRASATIGTGVTPRPGGVDTDLMGVALNHSLDGQFWDERRPDVEAIEVPTLVVAWWYNIGLHLRGTLIGYERLTSTKRLLALAGDDSEARNFDPKFLSTHLKPWYDHWLKDIDNGVMDTPPVRIDVQNGEPSRAEQSWPLERAVPTPFYLDPAPAARPTRSTTAA